MRILVTNDDGVYAPGIAALFDAMESLGEVYVSAPDRDMSATSNSLSVRTPIRAKSIRDRWFSVEGTPTDAVHLGVTALLDKRPDIVVSGINDGSNLGDDVLYSGTVAAAMEARFMGIPAIAFSLGGQQRRHYETAGIIAQQLVPLAVKATLPADMLLNVNIPDCPIDDIKGFEVARLGKRHGSEDAVPAEDPKGRRIYWVGPPGAEADAGPGTDFFALRENKVALTPINLDMTHYKHFELVSSWLDGVKRQCA